MHILEVYFATDDEEGEIDAVVPETDGSQFTFGGQAAAPDGGFNFAGEAPMGDQPFQ